MFQDNTTKIAFTPLRAVSFKLMDDLDDIWEQLLVEARNNGSPAGHFADFLTLKWTNDKIREEGVGQLLKAFEALAAQANRNGAGIVIESNERSQFTFEKASLSGPSMKLRLGVRCLTVEAGWTRRPGDGFMRGNSLAAARITHFGIPSAQAEIMLLKFEDRVAWFRSDSNGLRISIEPEDLIRHFQIFLG